MNRGGVVWWWFQHGQIQQCPCAFYELWMENHAHSYKIASSSDFSEVRPDTFWFDLATSVSIGWGQSRPHFKKWFIVDWGLPQKLCRANKTCYIVRGSWHYPGMGKMITFMKSISNNWYAKQCNRILWQTPLCMYEILIMALKKKSNLHS